MTGNLTDNTRTFVRITKQRIKDKEAHAPQHVGYFDIRRA